MTLPIFNETKAAQKSKIKNILAVAAGKGGVGKSAITVNLALSLKELGYRVGILDADIYGPSIRKMLPEDRLPGQTDGKLVPAMASGISIMSMAFFRKEAEAAIVRAPIANKVIMQFLDGVNWPELDFLLIDFPPGTGDIQLTLTQMAQLTAAIMVTTPQQISLLDVGKAITMFEQVKVPVLGVVENMSWYWSQGVRVPLFGQGGGERLAREHEVPLLGQIPIDPLICQCGDEGKSLMWHAPSSEAATSFKNLAQEVVRQLAHIEGEAVKFDLNWSKGFS